METIEEFENFARDQIDGVYGYAVARVGAEAAHEIVHDVFTAATHTFTAGGGELLSRAWLITCARYRIIDMWRETTEPESRAQAALALRFLEGRSVPEVAHILEDSIDATSELIEHARRTFESGRAA